MEENSKHTSDKKVFIITPDELAKLGILDSLTAEIKNKNAEKKLETTASTSAIKPKHFFKDNTEKMLLDLFKQNKVGNKSEDDKVFFKKPRIASKDNATITKFPQTVEEEIQIIDNDLSMASSSKDQSAYNISISKSPIIPSNKRKLESKTAKNKRGSMIGHADPNKTPDDSSVPEKNLINVISTSLKDKLKKNIFNKGKVSTSSRPQDFTKSVNLSQSSINNVEKNILKINEQFKNVCRREKTKNKIVILENIKISGSSASFDNSSLVTRPKTDHNTNVQNQTTVIQNILENTIKIGFEASQISENPGIITSKVSLIQDDNNVNIPNKTELLIKNTVEDSDSVKPLDVRNNFENIKSSSNRTLNSNRITPKKRFLTDKLHESTRIVGLPINVTPQKEISSETEEPVIKNTSSTCDSTCDVDKEKPCDMYVQPSAFIVPKKRGRPRKSSADTYIVDKNVDSVEKCKSTTEIKIKDMEEIETLKNKKLNKIDSNLVINTLADTLAKQKSLLCDEHLNPGTLIPKKRSWRSSETVINDDNEQTNDTNDAKIEANVTKSEGEDNVLKDTYSDVECSSSEEVPTVEKESSSSEVNTDFNLREKLLKKNNKPNLNQTRMVQTIATPQRRDLLHLTNIDDDEDQTISDQSQLKNNTDDHKGGSELDQEKRDEKSLLKNNESTLTSSYVIQDGSEGKKSIYDETRIPSRTNTQTHIMVEVNSTDEIPQHQSILRTDLPVEKKFELPQKKLKLQNNVENEIITEPDSTIEILDVHNDGDKSTFEETFYSINTSSTNSEIHPKLKRGKKSKSEYVAPPEENIELPMEKSTRGRRHVKINYLELENMFVEDTYSTKQIKKSDKNNTPGDTSFNSSDVTPKKKRGRPRKSEVTQPEKMEKAELENVPRKLKEGDSIASRAEEKNDVDFNKEFEVNTNIDTQHSTDIDEKQNIVISEIDSINSIDTVTLKNQIISTLVSHHTSFNSSEAMPKKKRGRPRKSEVTQPEVKMEVAELKNVPSKPKDVSNIASKDEEKNDVAINQESKVKTNVDTQHSTDIDEKNYVVEEKSEIDLISTIISKDQTIFTPVPLDNTPEDTLFNILDVKSKKKKSSPHKSEVTQPGDKIKIAELKSVPSKAKDANSTPSKDEEKNYVVINQESEVKTNVDTQPSTDIDETKNVEEKSEIDSINSISTTTLKDQTIYIPVPQDNTPADTSFYSSDVTHKKKRGRPRKSEVTQPEVKMEVAELKNVPSKPKDVSNTASKDEEKNYVAINQESKVKTNVDSQYSTNIDEKNNVVEEKSEIITITAKDQTIFSPVPLDNTAEDTSFNILDVKSKKKESRPHKSEVTQPGGKIKVAELKSVPSKPKDANSTPSKDEEKNNVVINQESEVKTNVDTQPSTDIDETKNVEEKSEIDSINYISTTTLKDQTIYIPVPQDNTPADIYFYSTDVTHKKKRGRPRKSEVTQPEVKMEVAELKNVPSKPKDVSNTASKDEEKNDVAINQESKVKTNVDPQHSTDIDEKNNVVEEKSEIITITAKDQTIFSLVPLDNTLEDTSLNILDVTPKKKKSSPHKSEVTQPGDKIKVAELKSVPSKAKDASSTASKDEEKNDVVINQESEVKTKVDTQSSTDIDETKNVEEKSEIDSINYISTTTLKDQTIYIPVPQDNTPADIYFYSTDVTHKKKRGRPRKSEVTQPEVKMEVAELKNIPIKPKDVGNTASKDEEKNDVAINQESKVKTNVDTQHSTGIDEKNNVVEEKSEIITISAKDQTIFSLVPLDNTLEDTSLNILDVTPKKKKSSPHKSEVTQPGGKIKVAELKSVPSKPKDANSTPSKDEEKNYVVINQESEVKTNVDTQPSTDIDETKNVEEKSEIDSINYISTTTLKDQTIYIPVPQDNTPADTSFYSSDVTHKKKRGRPRKSEVTQLEVKMEVAELKNVPSKPKDVSNTASKDEEKNAVAINQESKVKTNVDTQHSTDIDEKNNVVEEKSEIDLISTITSKDQTIFTPVPLDNTPEDTSFNILDVKSKKKESRPHKNEVTQPGDKIKVAELKSVPSKPKDASSPASTVEENNDVAINQESEVKTKVDTQHSIDIIEEKSEIDSINSTDTITPKDRTIFTPVPQDKIPTDTSFYNSDVTHKKKRGRPRKSEVTQPEVKMEVAELKNIPSNPKDVSNTTLKDEEKNDVAINQESEVKTKQSTDIDETNNVVKDNPINSIETPKDQTIFTSVLHDDYLKNKEEDKEISFSTENSVKDLSELDLETIEEQPLLKHTANESTLTCFNDKPLVCDTSNEDKSIFDDYNHDESVGNETGTTCYRKFRRDRIPYRKNVKIPNDKSNISLNISNDNFEPPPKKPKSWKPKSEDVDLPKENIELPMEQSLRGRKHVRINYFELENMFDEDSNDFVTDIKIPDKANTQADTSLNSSITHKRKRGRPRKSDLTLPEEKLKMIEGENVPSKLQDDSGIGSMVEEKKENNFKSTDTNNTSDEANIIKTIVDETVLQSETEINLPSTFNQSNLTEDKKNVEHEVNNKTIDEEVNAIPSTSFENPAPVVKKWGKPKKDHSKDIKLMEIESQLDEDSNEEIRFIKKRKRHISSTDEEIIAEPVERQKYVYTGRYTKLIKDVFTAAVLKSDNTEESQNANINIQPRPMGRPKKNVESTFNVDNGRVTCVPCQIKIPEEEWIDHNENKHSNLSWREGEQVVLLDQPSLFKDKLKPLLNKNGSLNCTKCDKQIKKIQPFISHIEECTGIVINGDVTCSICNKSLPKKKWLFHKTKHNNLAWRVGEHPLDINNEAFVMTTLNAIYKAKKPLFCDKCGIVKKSVVGLLSHLGQCGNTDDAKIMCELCGKKMLPVSLPSHIKMVHETIKKEPSSYFEVDLEVSQKRRRAATKAIAKIDEFASDRKESPTHFIVNMNFEDNDSLTAFINKELEENSSVKCKISTCEFSSVNILDALSHLKDCSLKLDQRFTCKTCFLTEPTEKEINDHLQKVHNFGSKQKDPEYVYNAEDNNAHDLEDEMPLPRPPKRKRYPRTQLCRDAANFKHKPDFIYSVSRGKDDYNHLFSHAFEYAFEFRQKNYNLKNLFGNLKCDESFWNLIDDERLEDYMPQYELSCDVVFKKVKEKKNNFKDEIEFKKYELFKVEQQDAHITIFCGAPVRCLAWLPTPYESFNQPQILAVATSKNFDEKYNHLEHYSETTVIQFWNFGLLQNGQNITEPKLEFCLGVDNGPVWCMEWCPSGCYDAEESVEGSRRGLLAVAGHSMAVHIYSIPLLAEEQSGLFYKAKPALKLQIVKDNNILKRPIFPTKISWSKVSGHSHIAVGYSDGSVALYNLNSPSKLLKFIDKSSADVLMPYKILKTHSHFISAVSFIPIGQGNRWLLTSSFDKNVHLWDLYTDDKISLKKGKLASDVVWLTQWLSFISGGDESTAIGQASAVCNSHREYLYDVHTLSYSVSSFTSLSTSDWLNAVVHGNETGEIVISFLHQMLYEMSRMRKSNDYRYMIGYSKLIDKILSPEERATVDEEKITVLRNNPRQRRKSPEAKDGKSIYHWYEPFDYEEAAEKYGVAFFDTFELHKLTSTYSDSEPAMSNLYPLMAINQVSFNPNRQASLFFATGYQIGFVRVSYLKFLERDEQIRLSKST